MVVLSDFAPTLPGDFDLDKDVDGLDFLKFQRGEPPNPLSAAAIQRRRGRDLAEASPGAIRPKSTWLILLDR